MNRKLLLTGVAVAALMAAGAMRAQATDAPMTVASTWAGAYFGGHLGAAAMNVNGQFFPSESPGAPWEDGWGLVAGAHAGYNWQTDSFVWGLEVDVSATGMSTSACHDNSCPVNSGSERASAEIDMLGSLRLRLGMPTNDNLFYVTGGVAVRNGPWDAGGDSGLDAGPADIDKVGGVVGLGIEHRADEHFSFRLEGLYYFFGDITAGPDCCNSTGTDFQANPLVIRLGGTYHIN